MKQIAIGIENFKEVIDHDYFYIDKSELISTIFSDKVSFVQDREDLEKHLICPCFIISFLSKKKKMLIYLIV